MKSVFGTFSALLNSAFFSLLAFGGLIYTFFVQMPADWSAGKIVILILIVIALIEAIIDDLGLKDYF